MHPVSFKVTWHGALRVWRHNVGYLAVICATVQLPVLALEIALYGPHGVEYHSYEPLWHLLVVVPLVLLAMLAHHFLSGVLERVVSAQRRGHGRPGLVALGRDLPWVRLIVADVLVTGLTLAGYAALVVPGVAAATLLCVVMPLINLERQPVLATMARSARLVRPHFATALAVWATSQLAVVALMEALSQGIETWGHTFTVAVAAHLVPEVLLLPAATLPTVVLAFVLVDQEAAQRAAGVPRVADPAS